jgi:aryl-alcohol dehydrogenase-like predicted oxidoreductase
MVIAYARYSNGASEVVLGRAIKAIGMPRENIVVLTKVSLQFGCRGRLMERTEGSWENWPLSYRRQLALAFA